MSETSPMTTAEALLAFYREIDTAELPFEIIRDLMHQAGIAVMELGLAVKAPEQADV